MHNEPYRENVSLLYVKWDHPHSPIDAFALPLYIDQYP